MKKNGEIYYNFPAALMYGFWQSEKTAKQCLNNILYYYACRVWQYRDANKVKEDDFYDFILEKLGLTRFAFDNKAALYRATKEIRETYLGFEEYDGIYFSVSIDMFFDFYKHEKTEEERAGLLAYLATKSIIGVRKYALTNRFFLTSRMACNSKLVNELPEEVEKYRKRYHFDKLKSLLYVAVNVAIYTDRNIRGFYVSLKKDEEGEPDISWLAQQVKAKRLKNKEPDPLKMAIQNAKIGLQHHDSNEKSTLKEMLVLRHHSNTTTAP